MTKVKKKYWNRPYSQRQYDKIQGAVDKVNADNKRVNKGKKK